MKLPGGDNLLLAGDIAVAVALLESRTDKNSQKLRDRFRRFFLEECAKYQRVFYIAGNHEHYHGSWNETSPILINFLKNTNVTYLDNESVDLGEDTILWASTFWTDFNNSHPLVMHESRRFMNDFRLIYNEKDPISTSIVDTANRNSRLLLTKFLEENKNKKVVIMTHHSPSMCGLNARYNPSDLINYAYHNTKLEDLILDNEQIKVWVHGHTHDTADYFIGNTRVICNPRGYVGYSDRENMHFNDNLTFEV